MATIYYTGKARPVAQVSTAQITAYDAATTYTLTVNGVSVSVLGTTNADGTAAALAAAWEALAHPYFTPITATAATDTVTLTGPADGMPFTVTSSVTGGTGTIGSVATGTAADGPNHWGSGDNWSGGSAPANSDVIYVTKPAARLCWGIDISGTSPTRLVVRGDARIGLSFSGVATTADGDSTDPDAPEYRDQYLVAAITSVDVFPDESTAVVSGSGRLHINNDKAGASTTTIGATAQSPVDTSRPAVCLLFANASADIYVSGGRGGVGIAMGNPGETSTIGDFVLDDPADVSRVFLSEGVTHSTIRVNGGRLSLNSAATMPSITITGGTCDIEGTQAVTALVVNEPGEAVCNTTGTIGTLTQNGNGSVADFHRSGKSRTVTNYNFNAGERRIDTAAVTITNDNRSGRIIETVS